MATIQPRALGEATTMLNEEPRREPAPPDPTPQQRRRAVRAVAHHARDAGELAQLLDMLDLAPSEGRADAPYASPNSR
jgi:hypothetical protein